MEREGGERRWREEGKKGERERREGMERGVPVCASRVKMRHFYQVLDCRTPAKFAELGISAQEDRELRSSNNTHQFSMSVEQRYVYFKSHLDGFI